MHFELHDFTVQNQLLGTRVALLGGRAGIDDLNTAWRKLQQIANAERAFQRVFLVERDRVLALLGHDQSGDYYYVALAPNVQPFWELPFKGGKRQSIGTFASKSVKSNVLTDQAQSRFLRKPEYAALATMRGGFVNMAWEPSEHYPPHVIARVTPRTPLFYTDEHHMFRQR